MGLTSSSEEQTKEQQVLSTGLVMSPHERLNRALEVGWWLEGSEDCFTLKEPERLENKSCTRVYRDTIYLETKKVVVPEEFWDDAFLEYGGKPAKYYTKRHWRD